MPEQTKERVHPADLGIELGSGRDSELFKWLICCQLFSKPIRQETAADAFRELDRAGLAGVEALRNADWQHVVDVLGIAHYRRYDESTASRLIGMARALADEYGGSLNRLHDEAGSRADLERRLQAFKGIGETASQIFLRELAGVWEKA